MICMHISLICISTKPSIIKQKYTTNWTCSIKMACKLMISETFVYWLNCTRCSSKCFCCYLIFIALKPTGSTPFVWWTVERILWKSQRYERWITISKNKFVFASIRMDIVRKRIMFACLFNKEIIYQWLVRHNNLRNVRQTRASKRCDSICLPWFCCTTLAKRFIIVHKIQSNACSMKFVTGSVHRGLRWVWIWKMCWMDLF